MLLIWRTIDNYWDNRGVGEEESDSFMAIVCDLQTSNQQIWACPRVDMPAWIGHWLLGDFGEDRGQWELVEKDNRKL